MGREATPYESRSQLFFAVVWLVTTALLLTAFQTIGISQAFGDEGVDLSVTNASDFQLDAADPSEQALPTILYGGLLWSVADVEVTPTEEFLGRSVIDVELQLTNSLTSTPLRVSEREVNLVTIEGHTLPRGRFVDVAPRLEIEPGETKAVTFRVHTGHHKNPNPRDLALVVSESNRIPASIPLQGGTVEHEDALLLAVEARPVSMADPDDDNRQIVVQPIAGVVGINAGPYRAAVGERLALVKLEVHSAAGSEASGFLDVDFWSLVAGDQEVAPIAVTRTPRVDSTADDVTLLFAFPAAASTFELTASDRSASFTLVLPNS